MQIRVYGPLRSTTGKKTVQVSFEGRTVRDALDTFVEEYPKARPQLFDENDTLRASVRVTCRGERIPLDEECTANDELSIFPAVQGG